MNEKREHPRNPVTILVELTDSNKKVTHYIARDFSPTGAFLERNDNDTSLPDLNTTVFLKISWPLETHIPPVEVEADIMRVDDNGVGVKFDIK